MAASSQPPIPSRRPRALRDPPRPSGSSAPPIQSRGAKRDHLRGCSTAQTTTTHRRRGTKRARTALRGRTPPALSSSGGSGGTRDWANLGGDGPTGLIAELVLAYDVADYVRFRAVCRSWRRCSPDPRSARLQDGRFLPRKWIMLDDAPTAAPRRRRFLNVSTGECVRTDLPDLAEHTLLALSPEGLLLLLHEPTLGVRLLNPLTRQLTDLPPVTALLTPEQQRARRSGGAPLQNCLSVSGVGLADASTVAVYFRFPTVLAVAKPGDERWTPVISDTYMNSTLPFAGHFYCAIGSGIMVLESSDSAHQQPPRLATAVERRRSFNFCPMSDSIHLLDNAGELMAVHRTPRRGNDGKYMMVYMVYRVDLDAGALVRVRSLSGRAVFMGLRRAISVRTAAFPSLAADTLYPGSDCEEKTNLNRIEGYNVADGSSQPCYHGCCCDEECCCDEIVQPCSVVDCISHCIRGNGGHLA